MRCSGGRVGGLASGRAGRGGGGRAGLRHIFGRLVLLPAFETLSRGRAAAPQGDGARILGLPPPNKTITLAACPEAIHCPRAMCAKRIESARDGEAIMRHLHRHVVIGAMLTSLNELHSCRPPPIPLASSNGCSARATNCTTLWGELGSSGPPQVELCYPSGSSAQIIKTCLSRSMLMIDDR